VTAKQCEDHIILSLSLHMYREELRDCQTVCQDHIDPRAGVSGLEIIHVIEVSIPEAHNASKAVK
jgi:hypothetical protein